MIGWLGIEEKTRLLLGLLGLTKRDPVDPGPLAGTPLRRLHRPSKPRIAVRKDRGQNPVDAVGRVFKRRLH